MLSRFTHLYRYKSMIYSALKKTNLYLVLLLFISCKPQQEFSSDGIQQQGIRVNEVVKEAPIETPIEAPKDLGFADQELPTTPEEVSISGVALPPLPTPTAPVPTPEPVPTPKRMFSLTSRVDAPFTRGSHLTTPTGLNCNKATAFQCSAEFEEGTRVQMFMPTSIFVSNFNGRTGTLTYTGSWLCNNTRFNGVISLTKGASLTITMDRNWHCGALYSF